MADDIVTPTYEELPEAMPSGEVDPRAGDRVAMQDQLLKDAMMPESPEAPVPAPTEGSWFAKTGQVWYEASIALAAGHAVQQGAEYLGVDHGRDPDFDLNVVLERDKELITRLNEDVKNGFESSRDMGMSLINSNNLEEYEMNKERVIKNRESRKLLSEADWSNWTVGLIGGVATDMITASLFAKLGRIPNAIEIAMEARRLAQINRIKTATRASQIIHGAKLGTLYSTLDVGVHQLTDYDINREHYFIAMGAGATLGGVLGGIADVWKTRRGIEAPEVQKARENAEYLSVRNEPVPDDTFGSGTTSSAMVKRQPASADDLSVLKQINTGEKSGTAVAQLMPESLRSTKSVIRSLTREAEKTDNSALRNATSVLNRMFPQGVSGDTVEARAITVTQMIDEFNDNVTTLRLRNADVHKKFLHEQFGINNVRRGLAQMQPLELLPEGVRTKFRNFIAKGGVPDELEMKKWADDLAIRRGLDAERFEEGVETGYAEAYFKELGDTWRAAGWTDDQIKAGREAVTEISERVDDFMEKNWKTLRALEMVEEDQYISHYRTQLWNHMEFMRDPNGATILILRSLAGHHPDAEFINSYTRRVENDERVPKDHPDYNKPAIAEGESVVEWMKKNPATALEIAQEWADQARRAVADRLEGKAEAAEQKLVDEANRLWDKGYARTTEDYEKNLRIYRKDQLSFEKFTGRLADATDPEEITKIENSLRRLESKMDKKLDQIADYEARLRELEAKLQNDKAFQLGDFSHKSQSMIRKELAKLGKEARAKRSKAAQKRFIRARERSRAADTKPTVLEAAEKIVEAIRHKESGYGHVPDDIKAKVFGDSRFTLERYLRLNELAHEADTDRFLIRNPDLLLERYAHSVGRQIAFKENFGPLVGIRPGESFDSFVKRVKEVYMEGYEGPRADVAERLKMEKLFDQAVEELLGRTAYKSGRVTNSVISTAQSTTAAFTLGQVLLAMLGDIPLQLMAGGRYMTGIMGLMRNNEKILKKIAEQGDAYEELAYLIRGPGVVDYATMGQRFDFDAVNQGIPNQGALGKAERTGQFAAQVTAHASFSNAYNKWLKKAFGVDLVKQISKDVIAWDGLDDTMKKYYTRIGIGKKEADAMSKLPWKSFNNGDIRVPDIEAWTATEEGALLWRKYQNAFREAAQESVMVPGIGDRPFIANHPLGRVMMMYTSFAYTVGNRFFARVNQMAANKQFGPLAVTTLVALTMNVFSDYIRAYIRGNGDEWMEENSTKQGQYDTLKRVFLRSHFAVGVSGQFADFMGNVAGDTINRMAHEVGMEFDPIDTEFARLRTEQGLAGAVGGPIVGLGNTFFRALVAAADGDMEKAAKLTALRAPISNAIGTRLLVQALNDVWE